MILEYLRRKFGVPTPGCNTTTRNEYSLQEDPIPSRRYTAGLPRGRKGKAVRELKTRSAKRSKVAQIQRNGEKEWPLPLPVSATFRLELKSCLKYNSAGRRKSFFFGRYREKRRVHWGQTPVYDDSDRRVYGTPFRRRVSVERKYAKAIGRRRHRARSYDEWLASYGDVDSRGDSTSGGVGGRAVGGQAVGGRNCRPAEDVEPAKLKPLARNPFGFDDTDSLANGSKRRRSSVGSGQRRKQARQPRPTRVTAKRNSRK